jgi:hypothetical protein
MGLLDLLSGALGNQLSEQSEQKLGVEKSQMSSLMAMAAPLIMGALQKNAQKPDGELSLNHALQKHDGSVLDNLSGINLQDGGSILSKIFGNDQGKVEQHLSQQSGIGLDKIGPMLAMLAPVIMGYLGKQNQQAGSGGLGAILGQLGGGTGASSGNTGGGLMDLATKFLDKNGDGSMVDDLLGMFNKK